MGINHSIFILMIIIMYSFTLFYIGGELSQQIISLIHQYKLEDVFKSVKITNNNLPIFLKHIPTIPALIDSNSNTIIEKDKILEFIVRLNIHLNKGELVPYKGEPSLYTDYYSQFNSHTPENIIFYSTSAYHYISNKLPKIVTFTESPTISEKMFNKQYKTLMSERHA